MRFSTFTKHCDLIQSRLLTIQKQVKSLRDAHVVEALSEQQTNKLRLLCNQATQKHHEFEKHVNKLFLSAPDDDDIDAKVVTTFQESIYDLYIDIQSLCSTLLPSVQPEQLNESNSNVTAHAAVPAIQSIKLPQINLPTFSGNPEQWIAFHSLFENTVHKNESISNVEKFSYLLSCLADEPLNLVKSLPLNCANYIVAWQILTKRYHNTRFLISVHTNNILDLPHLHKPTVKQLRQFISLFNENQQALLALGYDITTETLILTSHILRKFDVHLRSQFEHKRQDSNQMPTVGEVLSFLETECCHQEAATLSTTPNVTSFTYSRNPVGFKNTSSQNKTVARPSPGKFVMLSNTSKQPPNCSYCASIAHNIYKCNEFNSLTPQNKFSFVKGQNLCINCFGTHTLDCCKSLNSCRVCSKRHHTLLHFNKPDPNNKVLRPSANNTPHNKTTQPRGLDNNSPSTHVGLTNALNPSRPSLVLLATALVQLSTENGHSIVVRAVLDSASQTTIISEHCANLLRSERTYAGIPHITGISSAQVKSKGLTTVNISSLSGLSLAKSHPVLILDRISGDMPRAHLSSHVKTQLKGYILADPTFDIPGPIHLLIGADLFAQTLLGPSITLGNNMPHAINTIFGYVVLGKATVADSQHQFSGLSTLLSTNEFDLHETLKRFWRIEEPPTCSPLSPEEKECEEHFMNTHSRDPTGRYVCRIPFKDDPALLGDSSAVARRTFHTLERKFEVQPDFKQKYVEFMADYQSSNHMTRCDSAQLHTKPHCFLPHHGVFKDGKIRVVFNASAPTSTNVTLNSIQHQGPKLHNDISDIILRFRQHKIVFSCDIKQMFRMISIHEDDQCFQLIYWREDTSHPLSIYQLKTVTYGMTSSPFLANRVINQLILDEGEHHPLAAAALKQQLYIDDALLGTNTVDEALELQQDVIGLLKKGGFDLRKWTSNHKKVLENLPWEHCISPLIFKSTDQQFVSILGLKWNPESDTFSYVISKPSLVFTKRAVLSAIAKIYDVTGMLAPLTFWAKSLMQYLWSLGLDWDTPLPDEIAAKWLLFINELPEIEDLRVPRYISLGDAINVQLHGFSDASELGFAACVYLRTEDSLAKVSVNLLIAKSRVAPLKHMTVPRLELCGAHLLAKLLHYCVEQLSPHYNLDSVTAWNDSTIALAWIHTPSYRLKTFVANRVSQIQELSPSCIWKHISTNDNPADPASRGLTASLLIRSDLWWFGPHWLHSAPTSWPQTPLKPVLELPETKPTTLNLIATVQENQGLDFINKFSSWTSLLHIMGYVLRFISCLKTKSKITHPLTIHELEQSNNRICWLVQKESFSEEINLITKKRECSNRIQRLAPFLDSQGILRVGGRLRNSNLPYHAKHQIILPKNHHIVHLIIDNFHKLYLHAGPHQLQSILQEKYWILSARSVIRSRIFRCIRCFRMKPKSNTPLMGDLPLQRVTPSRPFEITGVDYAGPFTVKLFHLRRLQPIKVYLCIFICFSTKAVHLEVVSDLTSEAYIAALTRFTSRRGLIREIHSDCGTNFVGAATILKNCFTDLLKYPETRRFAEENNISFHFLPPHAPHQGGLLERAVRSAKYHLQRVIGLQILTYEEFITLTTKVEAMLNSRPITPLSADPNDLEPLTPGHFLTGGPLKSLIEPQFHEENYNRLRRWQLVQAFSQHIWSRWQREYLQMLQQRSKWTKKQENLKVGDLVVIHEPTTPPLKWKLGRITAVSPGADGVVRVVQLRTATGNLSRPSVKVSLLPIN